MSYFTLDGFRYYIEDSGAGDPLVLLHGFTGSSASWQGLGQRFAEDYRVIAVDLPGHGWSDALEEIERYKMERVAEDLVNLMDRLEAKPAHWLGYSMGGRLALFIAIHHPQRVKSLILESASPGLSSDAERITRRDQDIRWADRIDGLGVQAFVEEWENLPLFATQERLAPAIRTTLRQQRLTNSAIGLANSLRGMGTGSQPSLWDKLGEIRKPVLLIAGALDEKFVAVNQQMSVKIPGAQFQIVDDAGHTVHLEQRDIFLETVMSFLRAQSTKDGENLSQAKQGYK